MENKNLIKRLNEINREIENMTYSKAKIEIDLEKLKEVRHNLLQQKDYNNLDDFKGKYYKYGCNTNARYHKIDDIILEEDCSNIRIQGLCITTQAFNGFKGVSIDNLSYWTQAMEFFTEISEEEFMREYNKVLTELKIEKD